jgi:two-component system sensor histidine kinase FlrB
MNLTPLPMDAAGLAEAFQTFARASDELTQAYNGLQGQVSDLTERLTVLMAALPAGVVLIDGNGCIEQLNHAALRMLGAVPAGTPWSFVQGLLAETETRGEFLLRHGDNELRVSLSETPQDTRGGRIALLHDVTEAWQMRQQTARNERLAAMGEMVAGLAHQLRTPLAAALLYTGHMSNPTLDQETRSRVTDRALERLRHLEKLIHDMLIFARGEALGRESFGVCELVAELAHTIEPVADRRKVAFTSSCGADERLLFGNRKEIASALLNLLENALQAVGESGQVALAADVESGHAVFRVQDNGRGIPDELQKRLFEPFFTTRADGTGLGLAIARGVARAHGGDIRLRSNPAEGTEFSFLIPLAPEVSSEASGVLQC